MDRGLGFHCDSTLFTSKQSSITIARHRHRHRHRDFLSTDQPTSLFDSQNSLTADPRSFSFPFFSSFNFASTTVSSAQPAQPSPAQPLRPLLVAVAAAAAAALHCLVFAFFCYFHSAASSIDYARPIDCLLAPQRGSPDLRSQASLLGC